MEGQGILYYKTGDREFGNYLKDKKIGNHAILQHNGKVKSIKY